MAVEEIDGDTLQIATRAWLAAMRRAYIRRHGSKKPCPIRLLEDYNEADQAVMAGAVKAALIAARPENVAAMLATDVTQAA